ncbi:MAG: hypothetical protein MUF87_20710 [Anaerolineae bacterium]|jgi:hypothetical protein|nr:hypothetical protein [Anaerolineae bacterium]
MTVTVQWDNAAKTTLRYDYLAPWTGAQFALAIDRAAALTHEKVYRADLILNQPGPWLTDENAPDFAQMLLMRPSSCLMILVESCPKAIRLIRRLFECYPELEDRLYLVGDLTQARLMISKWRMPRLI